MILYVYILPRMPGLCKLRSPLNIHVFCDRSIQISTHGFFTLFTTSMFFMKAGWGWSWSWSILFAYVFAYLSSRVSRFVYSLVEAGIVNNDPAKYSKSRKIVERNGSFHINIYIYVFQFSFTDGCIQQNYKLGLKSLKRSTKKPTS